jgi:hypothetical protein
VEPTLLRQGAARQSSLAQALLVTVGFFLVVVLLGRWADPFQYDTDEGLNLMKALLVARGYWMYSPMWNDQPPLFTVVLAGVLKVCGLSILAARILVAAFAGLLVGSMFDLVGRLQSRRAAWVAMVLLLASAWFLRLSYSVMIGLPALALAMASMAAMARWATGEELSRRRRWLLLIGSGLLLTAGIETKLLALLVVPALVALLWLGGRERGDAGRDRLAAMGVWVGVVLVCCGALFIACHPSMHQMVGTHVIVSKQRGWNARPVALTLMRRDNDLVFLWVCAVAAWGMGMVGTRWAAVPLIWFACGAIAVQFHQPVWYHYSLLLVLPAVWAGAMVIDISLHHVGGGRAAARWVAVILAGLLCYECVKGVLAGRRMFMETTPKHQRLVRTMSRYAGQTKWVVSDLPIYPFAAGLASPPELAVMSTKRREAGQLPDELVCEVLARYQPEQVLLNRIDFGPSVKEYLRTHYRVADQFPVGREGGALLYVRGAVATRVTRRSATTRKTTQSSR